MMKRRVYRCEVCDQVFGGPIMLEGHRQSHHKGVPQMTLDTVFSPEERAALIEEMKKPGNVYISEPDTVEFTEDTNSFEVALDQELSLLRETLIMKNKAYGDSFFNQIDKWGNAAIMIPISNKTDRLESLYNPINEEPTEESIDDSHLDGAGYHILARIYRRHKR